MKSLPQLRGLIDVRAEQEIYRAFNNLYEHFDNELKKIESIASSQAVASVRKQLDLFAVDLAAPLITPSGNTLAQVNQAGVVAPHKDTHKIGGTDTFLVTDLLDAIARITTRKNSGANAGSRRRLNLIEGANITLTMTDDAANEEIDITIAASGGGAGGDSILDYLNL